MAIQTVETFSQGNDEIVLYHSHSHMDLASLDRFNDCLQQRIDQDEPVTVELENVIVTDHIKENGMPATHSQIMSLSGEYALASYGASVEYGDNGDGRIVSSRYGVMLGDEIWYGTDLEPKIVLGAFRALSLRPDHLSFPERSRKAN